MWDDTNGELSSSSTTKVSCRCRFVLASGYSAVAREAGLRLFGADCGKRGRLPTESGCGRKTFYNNRWHELLDMIWMTEFAS